MAELKIEKEEFIFWQKQAKEWALGAIGQGNALFLEVLLDPVQPEDKAKLGKWHKCFFEYMQLNYAFDLYSEILRLTQVKPLPEGQVLTANQQAEWNKFFTEIEQYKKTLIKKYSDLCENQIKIFWETIYSKEYPEYLYDFVSKTELLQSYENKLAEIITQHPLPQKDTFALFVKNCEKLTKVASKAKLKWEKAGGFEGRQQHLKEKAVKLFLRCHSQHEKRELAFIRILEDVKLRKKLPEFLPNIDFTNQILRDKFIATFLPIRVSSCTIEESTGNSLILIAVKKIEQITRSVDLNFSSAAAASVVSFVQEEDFGKSKKPKKSEKLNLLEVIQTLLEFGADPLVRNKQKESAFFCATQQSDGACLEILSRYLWNKGLNNFLAVDSQVKENSLVQEIVNQFKTIVDHLQTYSQIIIDRKNSPSTFLGRLFNRGSKLLDRGKSVDEICHLLRQFCHGEISRELLFDAMQKLINEAERGVTRSSALFDPLEKLLGVTNQKITPEQANHLQILVLQTTKINSVNRDLESQEKLNHSYQLIKTMSEERDVYKAENVELRSNNQVLSQNLAETKIQLQQKDVQLQQKDAVVEQLETKLKMKDDELKKDLETRIIKENTQLREQLATQQAEHEAFKKSQEALNKNQQKQIDKLFDLLGQRQATAASTAAQPVETAKPEGVETVPPQENVVLKVPSNASLHGIPVPAVSFPAVNSNAPKEPEAENPSPQPKVSEAAQAATPSR
jgi:hypothetical protein